MPQRNQLKVASTAYDCDCGSCPAYFNFKDVCTPVVEIASWPNRHAGVTKKEQRLTKLSYCLEHVTCSCPLNLYLLRTVNKDAYLQLSIHGIPPRIFFTFLLVMQVAIMSIAHHTLVQYQNISLLSLLNSDAQILYGLC